MGPAPWHAHPHLVSGQTSPASGMRFRVALEGWGGAGLPEATDGVGPTVCLAGSLAIKIMAATSGGSLSPFTNSFWFHHELRITDRDLRPVAGNHCAYLTDVHAGLTRLVQRAGLQRPYSLAHTGQTVVLRPQDDQTAT